VQGATSTQSLALGKGEYLKMSSFSKYTLMTGVTQVLSLVLALGTSIIIARALGPEGKGVYSIVLLLPSLIVTLSHLGISFATVYYVAQRRFPNREVLGSNAWLAGLLGVAGVAVGIVIVFFFQERVVPGVPQGYLFFALTLIPVELFFSYVRYFLLGAQRIKEFNTIALIRKALSLTLVTVLVWIIQGGVLGAVVASLLSCVIAAGLLFVVAARIAGGISFRINLPYMRKALAFGVQAHLGNIFWFLTHRIDLLLVNAYLGPLAVGYYSVGVALAEYLWMISQAASTVLLPKVAAETDEGRRRSFTPVVARTVLLVTALGAAVLGFLSRWIVGLLYSEAFHPAVQPFQILLFGIVALSAGRVLANDIAGRGRPMLNTYVIAVALIVNIALNVVLIPRYEVTGAAWASSISYTLILIARLFLYCRLSGNSWTKVILPQRGDWALYWRTAASLTRWVNSKLQGVLR